MLYGDTIAAIATPPGEGGVGIVRLSGPDALAIIEKLFRPAQRKRWRPQLMRLGHIHDHEGRVLDEALAVWFRGPRSYTGEDVCELQCHGGPVLLQQVLKLALLHGARLAEPGEFTMRAFASGRIDLTQAEAVLDAIQARTRVGLLLAQDQLGGWLARAIRAVRELILHPLAYLTALVDFPEDDVPAESLAPQLAQARDQLAALLRGAEQGMLARQGVRAVLVGQPNAGKSSLLNALLRRERAIVTPIPGTTRDTIEELVQLAGLPITLTDTAGITETADPVEQIGVERSRAALQRADLALLLIDGSRRPDQRDRDLLQLTAALPTVLVITKADLPQQLDVQQLTAERRQAAVVRTSAVSGAGLEELGQAIARIVLGGLPLSDAHLVTNPRHQKALTRALAGVDAALAGLTSVPADLLVTDLTDAMHALGEITGESLSDDLLHAIFSRFCIGK